MRAVSPGATSRSQAATPRRSSTSVSSGAREKLHIDVDILLLGEGHGVEKADGSALPEVFSTENAIRRCCSFSEMKMPRSPSSSDRSIQ
jgi:hypothetical protein